MRTHSHLLIAIDLEPSTIRVLDAGLRAASDRLDSEVVVIHVMPKEEVQGPGDHHLVRAIPAELGNYVHECVYSALDRLSRQSPRARIPKVQVVIAMGDPGDEILWHAEHLDADLIVVGSRGKTIGRPPLLGSVSEMVVRLAGCAVTVVRQKSYQPNVLPLPVELFDQGPRSREHMI